MYAHTHTAETVTSSLPSLISVSLESFSPESSQPWVYTQFASLSMSPRNMEGDQQCGDHHLNCTLQLMP